MSYDLKILKEFIAREINSSTLGEALGSAGGGFGDENTIARDQAGGTKAYSQRWGWSSFGEDPSPVRAKGILGLLGLPQSVPDAWNAWFGTSGVFDKIFSIVGESGRLFIDVLFNNITPSTRNQTVETWTRSMFPGSAAYMQQGVAQTRLAPGPVAGMNFSPGRFGESVVRENIEGQDSGFVEAFQSDLEGIRSWVNSIKSSATLDGAVSQWNEFIETDGNIQDLVASSSGVQGLGAVQEIFSSDVVSSFVSHILDKINIALTNSPNLTSDEIARAKGLISDYRSNI